MTRGADNPAIMTESTVCDLTLPFLREFPGREEMLDRYHDVGMDFVSLSVATDGIGTGSVVQDIADVHAMIRARSDRMVLARSVSDIRAAKREGRLAIGLNFQGSDALERNPNMVQVFFDLGVGHMLFVYNEMNAAGAGCLERVDGGLSRFGYDLVAEMNRVGMLIDGTHTGYRTTMEILEASESPVIFSHSNAHAVYDHPRNITDDQALACARTGGVVGVCGVGKFLGPAGTSEVGDMLPHIRYFADLIGPEHVALASDHVYFLEQHYRNVAAHPNRWPGPSNPPPPWHYFAPEQFPALAAALLDSGFTDEEARGILGENFLRVAERVWGR
jgi:membrane dipeptidase